MIFVSPGRCGTTRIAEILREKLPHEEFAVTHQMPFSRLANIVGNMMYHFGQSEKIKEYLYNFIVSRYIQKKHFITTDPLTAMIIPKSWVELEKVCIVQITRDPEEFAQSFFRFSRDKPKSFIAHNFIPFWQPGIFPLQNFLGPSIKHKYKKICQQKESFFSIAYTKNPNYKTVSIKNLLSKKIFVGLINNFFCTSFELQIDELSIKSNQSLP